MKNSIGRIFESLTRVCKQGQGQGRHRSVKACPSVSCGDTPILRLPRVHQVPRQPVLRGEDVGLVRPYLVAHERRKDVPRVELLCAPHGMVVVR